MLISSPHLERVFCCLVCDYKENIASFIHSTCNENTPPASAFVLFVDFNIEILRSSIQVDDKPPPKTKKNKPNISTDAYSLALLLKKGKPGFCILVWVAWNQQGAVLFGRKWLYSSRFSLIENHQWAQWQKKQQHSEQEKDDNIAQSYEDARGNIKTLSDDGVKCWWTRCILGDRG